MSTPRKIQEDVDPLAPRKRRSGPVEKGAIGLADSPGKRQRATGQTVGQRRGRQARPAPQAPWERERQGVTPRDVIEVSERLGWTEAVLLEAIGLPQSSWSRKKTRSGGIVGAPGIAVLALQGLMAKAHQVAEATVDPDVLARFDVDEWLGRWLQTPMPALGAKRPAEFLDVPSGQAIVSRLLGALESGAYQ